MQSFYNIDNVFASIRFLHLYYTLCYYSAYPYSPPLGCDKPPFGGCKSAILFNVLPKGRKHPKIWLSYLRLSAYFASLVSKHIPSWQGFCNRMAWSKGSSLDLTTLDSYNRPARACHEWNHTSKSLIGIWKRTWQLEGCSVNIGIDSHFCSIRQWKK